MNPGAAGRIWNLTSLLEASGEGKKLPRPPTGQKEKDSSRRKLSFGASAWVFDPLFAWGPDPSAAKGVMVSDIDYPRPQ